MLAEEGHVRSAVTRAWALELPTHVCGLVVMSCSYDQCFDQWYKDVFLLHKANGQVGCQAEYKAYSECFLKELGKDTALVEGIKSVMAPDVRQRWEAQTNNSSDASEKKPADAKQ
ncbi:hypothetical protein PINS_up000578 [Pythium insidiosum]|nr:hypothetical protein PINS_up000578 [Pythium insidiosum]